MLETRNQKPETRNQKPVGSVDILMGGRQWIPEGPLKIARQFTGGIARGEEP